MTWCCALIQVSTCWVARYSTTVDGHWNLLELIESLCHCICVADVEFANLGWIRSTEACADCCPAGVVEGFEHLTAELACCAGYKSAL